LLQRVERITYRALKREFALDEEMLNDLKDELIVARRIARDEDGKVLVWIGEQSPASRVQSPESQSEELPDPRDQTLDSRPISYTPLHLAERIRAVNVTDGE